MKINYKALALTVAILVAIVALTIGVVASVVWLTGIWSLFPEFLMGLLLTAVIGGMSWMLYLLADEHLTYYHKR